jgi:vanillate O-demethylase ferredoxin subunit
MIDPRVTPVRVAPTPTPLLAASTVAHIDTLVRSVRLEAEDIRSFELVALLGEKLPAWVPGAHVQVVLPDGITRAYSLCNHGGETSCYRIAVKLEAQSRGGSRAMHRVVPGDRLRISPPRNLFALDHAARRHVLIAGGIGITPLYAMFNALKEHAACEMHYFARSNLHAAFTDHLTSRTTLHHGLDVEDTRQALRNIASTYADSDSTIFYTCGPSAFMAAVEQVLAAAGVPASQLRSERFGSDTPVANVSLPADTFRIVFARSGIEADVTPGQAIIDVARTCGVDIPTSCEQGVCGACLSDVIEGQPAHHDAYLSAAEQAGGKIMLPCVSRCAGARLVINR